ALIFASLQKRRPVRLGVRTPDFHSGNRGSIPLRATDLQINTLKLAHQMIASFFVVSRRMVSIVPIKYEHQTHPNFFSFIKVLPHAATSFEKLLIVCDTGMLPNCWIIF